MTDDNSLLKISADTCDDARDKRFIEQLLADLAAIADWRDDLLRESAARVCALSPSASMPRSRKRSPPKSPPLSMCAPPSPTRSSMPITRKGRRHDHDHGRDDRW